MSEEDMSIKISLSFGFLEYRVHKDVQNSYTVTRIFKVFDCTNIIIWKDVAEEEIYLLIKFKS